MKASTSGRSVVVWCVFVIALSWCQAHNSGGREIFVSPLGAHHWPFANWGDAATNLVQGVMTAADGDIVSVTDGVYVVVAPVEITNGVLVQSVNGFESTTVCGGYPASSNRCFFLNHPNAIVAGFTVTNGWVVDGQYGGGVYCSGAGLVRNCRIIGNRAGHGGGVACVGGGKVQSTLLRSNRATTDGGGIYLSGGSASSCVVSSNEATYWGGGVLCVWGGDLTGCAIVGNSAGYGGGGVNCAYGATLRFCSIIGNTGDGGGGLVCTAGTVVQNSLIESNRSTGGSGGVAFGWGGQLLNCLIVGNKAGWAAGVGFDNGGTLQNCTVTANEASGDGGGIEFSSGGQAINTIVQFNTASNGANWFGASATSMLNCCSSPMPPGWGNITNDPGFMNSVIGDYRLVHGSPCIDNGTNLSVVADDYSGVPRPLDGDNDGVPRWDIGSCEFVNPLADTDADQMPDGWEVGFALNPLTNDAAFDPDSDTANNLSEYHADTDPTDPLSVLTFLSASAEAGGLRLDWKGGQNAWQFLETRDTLSSNDAWHSIFAIPPPTPLTNAVIDLGATNAASLYRLRVER